MWAKSKQSGFTIVELLIVIVVIGILAAITIVAFNGVQNKARVAAAQNSVESAVKKIGVYAAQNSDAYPSTLADAGLTGSGNTSYQYTFSNTSPRTYCVTVTVGNVSYYENNTDHTAPTAGACSGHGVNGAIAVTNMVVDPRAATTTFTVPAGQVGWRNTRWAGGSPAAGYYTPVSGATDGPISGIGTYIRKTWTTPPGSIGSSGDTGFDNTGGSGTGTIPVTAGDKYAISCYLRPSVNRNFEIGVYQYTSTGAAFSDPRPRGPLTPGPATQWTRVSYIYQVPTGVFFIAPVCDSTSSTLNGAANWVTNSTLDGTAMMMTKTDTLYDYGDGATAGWVWNGTANASSSTGSGSPS